MRKFSMLLAAAALAVVLVGTGTAQDEPKKDAKKGERQPPGGGGGFGGRMGGGFGGASIYGFLANNKDLQAELKITDEQKKKFEDVAKEQQAKMRELFTGGGIGRDATEEQRKEMMEKMTKAAAETKKAYEAVLTSEQAKRVTQINYQYMNVRAFSDKDVQTALKMTDDQKEKIKTVMETYQKDSAELRGGRGAGGGGAPGRPSEENQKKLEALRKDVEEKIVATLKDDQKKEWKGMIGEKFDVSKLTFQPMRSRDQ